MVYSRMRCVIQRRFYTPGRNKYFYKIAKLFMLQKKSMGETIELVSVPDNAIDVMFVIGHNTEMCNYLSDNWKSISEKTIVVISCMPSMFKRFCNRGKQIFVTTNKDGLVHYYEGEQYGFDFQITDAELNLYNNTEIDFNKKLENVFEKLT